MDSKAAIDFLIENSLSDVDIVKDDGDKIGVVFFYDFDKVELAAASAYANEESDYDQESSEWYSEMFLPYLKDIAVDNVSEILEDLSEELGCEYDMKWDKLESGSYQYMKFYVVLQEENEVDAEEYFLI